MNTALLQSAANQARGLAMDAVHKCNSGHLGLPLGSAEIGAVLFGESLVCNPDETKWLNDYHARVLKEIGDFLEGGELEWLKKACAPL